MIYKGYPLINIPLEKQSFKHIAALLKMLGGTSYLQTCQDCYNWASTRTNGVDNDKKGLMKECAAH